MPILLKLWKYDLLHWWFFIQKNHLMKAISKQTYGQTMSNRQLHGRISGRNRVKLYILCSNWKLPSSMYFAQLFFHKKMCKSKKISKIYFKKPTKFIVRPSSCTKFQQWFVLGISMAIDGLSKNSDDSVADQDYIPRASQSSYDDVHVFKTVSRLKRVKMPRNKQCKVNGRVVLKNARPNTVKKGAYSRKKEK